MGLYLIHGSVSFVVQDSFAGDDSFSGLESLTLITLSCNPKLSRWAADCEARWALSLTLCLANHVSLC